MPKINDEILASASRTASGNSEPFAAGTINMLAVSVDVTVVSGSTPTLTVFLQASLDDKTSWYDFPFDMAMPGAAGATNITADVNKRNIVDESVALGGRVAIYKHLPPAHLRLKYMIAGGSPDFTFSAHIAGA